jgi:hypothetical protein
MDYARPAYGMPRRQEASCYRPLYVNDRVHVFFGQPQAPAAAGASRPPRADAATSWHAIVEMLGKEINSIVKQLQQRDAAIEARLVQVEARLADVERRLAALEAPAALPTQANVRPLRRIV